MRKIIFLSLITPLAVVFFIVGSILGLFRGKETPPVEKTKILAVRNRLFPPTVLIPLVLRRHRETRRGA